LGDAVGLVELGIGTVEFILGLAKLLVNKEAPGIVSLGLVTVLAFLSVWFWWAIKHALSAIKAIRAEIITVGDEKEFATKYIPICSKISDLAKNKNEKGRLARAWNEFRETLIEPKETDGSQLVLNTCRPNVFFNREDLHLEHGFWKYLPNLFVSLGLFLTFLGLISALNEASGSLTSSGSQDALIKLLSVATAKFIMSLTGLFCSILFSVLCLRTGSWMIDNELISLCDAIESRVRFVPNEGLQKKQIDTLIEQKEILQTFSNDLVAQVGRPLREELPQTIKNSIAEAIAPVAEGIKKSSTDGVGEMVNSISDRLAGGFEKSLNTVSETLLTVGANLDSIASRMDASSGKMGAEMDSAVQRLSDSIEQLQGMMTQSSQAAADVMQDGANSLLESMNAALVEIKDNTAESSLRLEEAANKISSAAEGFNDAMVEITSAASSEMKQKFEGVTQDVTAGISSAGSDVASSMTDAVKLLTEEADRFAEAMTQKLTTPIDELRVVMKGLNDNVSTNSEKIGRYAGVIERSSEATNAANDLLVSSVKSLSSVAEPIRTAITQTENAATQMSRSVNEASNVLLSGVEKSNDATVKTLEAVNEAFNQSRQSVDQSMEGLNTAVSKFGDVVERYDVIDENLGEAFRKIENSVQGTVDEISKFTNELHDQYEGALTKLRNLVDTLTPFDPKREQ
jgi:methyl-accepting chemotaxis protein